MKKYYVTLTRDERALLDELTASGKRGARVLRHAYILLNVDQSDPHQAKTDWQVADFLGITVQTVENIRKKFVLEGFETALYGRPTSRSYLPKVDGDAEAHLVALSCSEPPEGFVRWSLRLLAQKMVALEYIEAISHETVRQVLKKTK